MAVLTVTKAYWLFKKKGVQWCLQNVNTMKKTVLVQQFYGVFKHLNLYTLSLFYTWRIFHAMALKQEFLTVTGFIRLSVIKQSVSVCVTSVLPWRIIHTVRCGLREEISAFLFRERVALERLRPPKKYFSTTHTSVPHATTHTLSERDCCSPTQCWR